MRLSYFTRRFLLLAIIALTTSAPLYAQQPNKPLFEQNLYLHSTQPTPFETRAHLLTLPTTTDFSTPILLNLFDDLTLPVHLTEQRNNTFANLQIWTGRAADPMFDHLADYTNVSLVYDPAAHQIVGDINWGGVNYQLLPTAVAGVHRIAEFKRGRTDCSGGVPGKPQDAWITENGGLNKTTGLQNLCTACLQEKDATGRYVLDIFIGFSTGAATVAGNINAFALSQVQSVNIGLTNSGVTDVYMRLVGTGVTTHNPGVITPALDSQYLWFAQPIDSLAPDFVCTFQTLTGAPNEAGGWGYVPGYATVCNIGQPTAFRHEIGHNAGGGHCPGDGSALPYAHGFNNNNWTTHLCGNGTNFYSSPRITDNQNNKIGDSATADMARTFSERADEMARHATHRVKFFPADSCAGTICKPSHWGGELEVIKTLVFNTINNDQTTPGWTCPAITGYSDYTNLSTTVLRNTTYPITITPNYSYAQSKVGVWIDWNGDNRFSAAERMATFSGNGPWTAPITVPAGAALTTVRMRVRLQYGTAYEPDPCAGSAYSSGETEDYTVKVTGPAGVAGINGAANSCLLYPNPAGGAVSIRFNGRQPAGVRVIIQDLLGRTVLQEVLRRETTGSDFKVDVSRLPRGVYHCVIAGDDGQVVMKRLVKN